MAVTDTGAGQSFVARLALDEIAALRARAVPRRFERGATLMHHDEVPGRVLVIERGHAKVTLVSEDGREIVLAFRGPGDLLGEVSALGGEPRSATVRALESIDALAMAAGDFDTLLEEHPRIALVVLRLVIERLREADRHQFELAAYQTLGRVARRIVELAERFGEPAGHGGVRIALGISQEELAGWAGASRESTSKALHDLRAMSLIETERRHITVRSLDELRRIA
jgi:CRP-like cAMP-binding protein